MNFPGNVVAHHGRGAGAGRAKSAVAEALTGGVIIDVGTPEQAAIAEDAGAVAVMAVGRSPADQPDRGSRMCDPDLLDGIIDAVRIPVMAQARVGHFVEAQVLQSLGVDYIDESEELAAANDTHHIDKRRFTVPFVCGAEDLGDALRRVSEGAAIIRSRGAAGTARDFSDVTAHMYGIRDAIARLTTLSDEQLLATAKELGAPYGLVGTVAGTGKLPVPLFAAGDIATPVDAAMMMQLGADGVFVGSAIFESGKPAQRAAAIVRATTAYNDPDTLAKVSRGFDAALTGIDADNARRPRLGVRGAAFRADQLV